MILRRKLWSSLAWVNSAEKGERYGVYFSYVPVCSSFRTWLFNLCFLVWQFFVIGQ
ncbi:Uncharacterized protein APZ42_014326 [Daphnia magna]|uniref:Uncharacterized protein n=1 Tax=Daphnia magna TaxID=35525 RepID=A0A162Q6W5_9CRUS|nr:Uncharacterized protein APZ42_014326 [Daphnia magna]